MRLGLSRAEPSFRGQLGSDLQPFQRLPSHFGAECFKRWGKCHGAHGVSQVGASSRRPRQLQYSFNPVSHTTSEEQNFNMLNIYSLGQIRLPGHERTIRVGRFKRQT